MRYDYIVTRCCFTVRFQILAASWLAFVFSKPIYTNCNICNRIKYDKLYVNQIESLFQYLHVIYVIVFKANSRNDLYTYLYLHKSTCVYLGVKTLNVHIWDSCCVVTDQFVPLHKGRA